MRALASVLLVVLLALPVLAQPGFPPVSFTSVRSPVPRGGEGMVAIKTSPSTLCSIAVIYASGQSRAAGLYPKNADTQGLVTWTWKVGTRTTPGVWSIVIECGKDKITRVRTSFEVR
jgi:hypothetical protein